MSNIELVEKFYTSFSKRDAKGMTECYHEEIVFQDPVFGTLKGERAVKMWEMLLSRGSESTTIVFENIKVTEENGSATWIAKYTYGENNRKVTNIVNANFKFKDGKIIEHIDYFDLWKWTKQAIGVVGYLVGWTPFMKSKIQKTTNQQLEDYIDKK